MEDPEQCPTEECLGLLLTYMLHLKLRNKKTQRKDDPKNQSKEHGWKESIIYGILKLWINVKDSILDKGP